MPKIAINGIVRDMTAEETSAYELDQKTHGFEMAINTLRSTRNSLLAKTDWTALSDNTMSDAMKNYRQQLRDATEGLDTVEKVQAYEFPEEILK
jgi:hypothetical protein